MMWLGSRRGRPGPLLEPALLGGVLLCEGTRPVGSQPSMQGRNPVPTLGGFCFWWAALRTPRREHLLTRNGNDWSSRYPQIVEA